MFEKEYTLDSFKINTCHKTIKATGRFCPNSWFGKYWDINYSDILSKLIQETGRLCDHYASDLFISWNEIEEGLKNPDWHGGKFLFGLRDSGVDHNSFVLSRYNQEQRYARYNYRKMYLLIVTVELDGDISMELGEVYA